MNAQKYNPLTYSDNLKKAGMDERIANVIAQQQAEIISLQLNENISTKDDIKEILSKIDALEQRMTIKFGTIMLIGVGLLSFLMKHT